MAADIRESLQLPRLAVALAVVLGLSLAGCSRPQASTDVASFARLGNTPQAQAILRSIGVYRTSKDLRKACTLVTSHFIKARYDNHEVECEYFSRQAPRTLPRSAAVESVSGGRARVRIRELSSTRSIYLMALDSGIWKIDDIVEPPKGK